MIVSGFSKRHEAEVEAGRRSKGPEDVVNRPDAELARIEANRAERLAAQARQRTHEDVTAGPLRRSYAASQRAAEAERQARVRARVEQRRAERERSFRPTDADRPNRAGAPARPGAEKNAPSAAAVDVFASQHSFDAVAERAAADQALRWDPDVAAAGAAARLTSDEAAAQSAAISTISDTVADSTAAYLDASAAADASAELARADADRDGSVTRPVTAAEYAAATAEIGALEEKVRTGPTVLSGHVSHAASSSDAAAVKSAKETVRAISKEDAVDVARFEKRKADERARMTDEEMQVDREKAAKAAKKRIKELKAEMASAKKTIKAAKDGAERIRDEKAEKVPAIAMLDPKTEDELSEVGFGSVAEEMPSMGTGARSAASLGTARAEAKASPVYRFHNRHGVVPGLLEHVKAAETKRRWKAEKDGDAGDNLRYLTHANAAYWPVAKVMIASVARHAPSMLSRLTVMLSDRRNMAECQTLPYDVDCFYDADVVSILGDAIDKEGSIGEAMTVNEEQKLTEEQKLSAALRVLWCWRKVHAVYTLIKAGYPAVYMDAATVVLNDPREAVTKHFEVADLVTLTDFGGEDEQETTNTGLVAAPPRATSISLFEEWMKLEDTATETEQSYLTFDLAPRLRKQGLVIHALSNDAFPSYLTFDSRHVRGAGTRVKVAEPSLGDAVNHPGGIAVHAAYCGTVKGKVAFMTRVEAMALAPGQLVPPERDELEGCDQYDRQKFLDCGKAPWHGDC